MNEAAVGRDASILLRSLFHLDLLIRDPYGTPGLSNRSTRTVSESRFCVGLRVTTEGVQY